MDIKRVIKARGMTVKEVAQEMGITPIGLSQHINGNPSVEVLERIAAAIGCEVSEFFEVKESRGDFVAFVRKDGAVNHFDKFDSLAAWVEDEKGGTQ